MINFHINIQEKNFGIFMGLALNISFLTEKD